MLGRVLTFLNLESSSKAPSDELSFSLKVASINVTVSFSILSIWLVKALKVVFQS